MYVAITRARKRLYLSFSQTRMLHGQTRYNIKSRFLDELPEAALKWITPRNQGFGSGFARDYAALGPRLGPALDRRRRPHRAARAPPPIGAATRRTACVRARACSTTSSAKAWSSRSKAAARTRAPRSTSAATA